MLLILAGHANSFGTVFCFRNSVDAGWFLMEFHIAHEQVIQGRKKYLIPILLKNVKTNKIKDPDLRMYVESHTYLNCTDKVIRISW